MADSIDIPDKNLKLALVDALIGLGRAHSLSEEEQRELDKEYAGEDDEMEGPHRLGYTHGNDLIESHYLDMPLSQEDLLAITNLSWCAGTNDIIFDIFTYWDGEDDAFTLERLQGIEHCHNLKELVIDIGHIEDLKPLANLKALEEISLSFITTNDLTSLEDLPHLQKLDLTWPDELKKKVSTDVFRRLAQRNQIHISSNLGLRAEVKPEI